MLTQANTETDPSVASWDLDDDVVQLREWGSHRAHRLPPAPHGPLQGDWMIGSASDCALRLADLTGRISRRHARLLRERSHWCLLDVGSKNGMQVDGTRQATALLEPGLEITLGGLTLVAESSRLIAVRGFLSRLLGWSPERLATVDTALRALRLAQVRRTPLILRGEGDWVSVARDLHRRVLGADRPFVLCAPRGPVVDGNLRGIANVDRGLEAISAARGGTLCVRSRRPPADFIKMVAALRAPSARVQLIVCDDSRSDAESALALPITIPSLLSRYQELPRIIDEYCRDAAEVFAARLDDSGEVRGWILRYAATSIPDIERAAYRLFALRSSKTVADAAAVLEISASALRSWLQQVSHDAGGPPAPWKVAHEE
jgi:hypothetical protein